MKKILVTGATGFIGRHIIQQMADWKTADLQVIASSGDASKAKPFTSMKNVQYIPCDLRQLDISKNYFDFFQRPDVMIHLAWEGLPNYRDYFHVNDNLPRHYSFLKNMIENGMKDLTVIGTCLEYGMREGELNEEMTSLPDLPYANAKDQLRRSVEKLKASYDFSFKWLRLFYLYGGGQNSKSLFSQLDRAITNHDATFNMSSGEQVRDYLPVEQAAQYIIKIALQHRVTGIINCCSGKPMTVRQLVENYLKKKNTAVKLNLGYYPYPDYEPMKFWGDTNKLKKALNHD
jgi:nucleoside-diphosphate-sugar epimerase